MTCQVRHRSVAMQRLPLACFATAIVASLALTGCATRYAPSTAPDTSKLRVRMGGAHLFSSVAPVLRPISNGQCGSAVSVPSIFPYSPGQSGTHHPAQTATATPPTFARAGMHGSTEASRSDSIELQLAPGRYIVALHGGLGTSICSVSGAIELQPHRQYEIEFRFDTVARKCLAAATRLDERDGRLQWVPQGMNAAPACG